MTTSVDAWGLRTSPRSRQRHACTPLHAPRRVATPPRRRSQNELALGWLYLATVIDCYSRAIVGWAMADHYRTQLITAAIEMTARNIDLPADAVFHSDRGSNYTSEEYRAVLERLGLTRSVGRTGICYDNALAESTNGVIKVELTNRRRYATRDEARQDIASYIEVFYNRRRHHSRLGYRTPWEVLHSYQQPSLAA